MRASEAPEHRATLEAAREAYDRRDWVEARSTLTSIDESSGLAPSDLLVLSTCAYMLGDVPGMRGALERAYGGYLDVGETLPAARTALWLASNLASRAKLAEAGGWVERAQRLIDPVEFDCAERGYLLLPTVLRLIIAGEMEEMTAVAENAAEIGRRFDEPDLVALSVQSKGRGLLRMGQTVDAFRLLDELMVSVIAGECSPMVTGLVYCSVIEGLYEIHEVRRAAAWTDSLAAWCGEQPDLVAFNDQCLAHRSEILRLRGGWGDALLEAQRSHDSHARGRVAAQASYQQAEIHRLRGDHELAEAAYGEVALRGGEPQPGLALLRLAQGNEDPAVASIRRAVLETTDLVERVRLLPGFVEVMVATGFLDEAIEGAAELRRVAQATEIDMHLAWANHSDAIVHAAQSDGVTGAARARVAIQTWEDLGLPYELAQSRVVLARSLRLMGDEESARIQFYAALAACEALGALPDSARIRALIAAKDEQPFGLTEREVEVLSLVASGATNREVAESLVVSERTIDRHVSNLFTKLGVNTRAAATSVAIRNGIV